MGGANNVVTWMPKSRKFCLWQSVGRNCETSALILYYCHLLLESKDNFELPSNINVHYYQTAKKRGAHCWTEHGLVRQLTRGDSTKVYNHLPCIG